MFNIFPSLLSANVLNLETVITELDPHCAGFHLDIMDNHFVPNLTWGPFIVNPLAQASEHPAWVHLMVADNLSIIHRLQLPARSIVSFHIESAQEAVQTIINTIEGYGWIASIALRPSSPTTLLKPWLTHISHVLIMSVEPGFSGQSFITTALTHLTELVTLKKAYNYHYIIGMDGGIQLNNIALLAAQGVTDFAVASAIFNQSNPLQAITTLKSKLTDVF